LTDTEIDGERFWSNGLYNLYKISADADKLAEQ
jgi:hypothetical protein